MSDERHPLNAPGDFYSTDGPCFACEAPEAMAPDLMGRHYDGDYYHCYFRRQPETPEELERAIQAVEVSCCEGLRYAGRDPLVIARLNARSEAAPSYHSSPCDHTA